MTFLWKILSLFGILLIFLEISPFLLHLLAGASIHARPSQAFPVPGVWQGVSTKDVPHNTPTYTQRQEGPHLSILWPGFRAEADHGQA